MASSMFPTFSDRGVLTEKKVSGVRPMADDIGEKAKRDFLPTLSGLITPGTNEEDNMIFVNGMVCDELGKLGRNWKVVVYNA